MMKDRFKLRVDLSFIYIMEVLWFLYENKRKDGFIGFADDRMWDCKE